MMDAESGALLFVFVTAVFWIAADCSLLFTSSLNLRAAFVVVLLVILAYIGVTTIIRSHTIPPAEAQNLVRPQALRGTL